MYTLDLINWEVTHAAMIGFAGLEVPGERVCSN